ncbi:S10 family serine carboxypeptidase-like protein [Phyllobacterium calauticae]|jgi:carboxypeptidase C (cathepsin A)|uniref:S10 family serine carboxypeptidase-like protein n=1 Tax=Phyllobacterium calauticae TaxID=2817027 RepID=UPI001CBC4AA1|nr:hypothetical protein [Phyllobacterium calauticae]MBZ3691991.1 hypothetical protein [Phyllobacterium calauticae]
MKLRILSLSILAVLAACNNSSDSPTTTDLSGGTFDSPVERVPSAVAAPTILADVDRPLEDNTVYGVKANDSIELSQVSEVTSLMHHTMKIKGEAVKFTARAGHLVAYKPAVDGGAKDPQAAIFYTTYTRDDLPRENRPVTFFWNGGPGSSSKYLHLGSWAPKRMVINPPVIPPDYFEKDQPTFPVIDDAETLLDQSDLVFIDPVGTGFSSAIAPHRNDEFWGIDSDPKLLRDFITRYINTYNRQSSPKYLYGESYGGIRTPITARLLLEAGTANYLPDPSGKPPVVLSGIVLQSPLLDYNSGCDPYKGVSCEGLLPTYAATADYFGLTSARGKRPLEDFLAEVRKFGGTSYRTVQQTIISKIANPSGKTPQQDYLEELAKPDPNDFRHLSEEAKEEKLKFLDALAPTPAKAFIAAALEISLGAQGQPLFALTKSCAQSQAKGAAISSSPTAAAVPIPPIEIDVDISSFKRELLSGKEFVLLKQSLIKPSTEKSVKSGDFFDTYINTITNIQPLFGDPYLQLRCIQIKAWSNYVSSPDGSKYLKDLHKYTGLNQPGDIVDSPWVKHPNMGEFTFLNQLIPGYSFNVYDARTAVPGMNYDPSFADSAGGDAAIADLLPHFVGYTNKTTNYIGLNHHILQSWDWTPDPEVKFSTSRLRTSIPDLIESLTLQNDLKVLVLHGYTDIITPFHQTELDLENAGLMDRVPVKTFEGGHMTYSNEASRGPIKALLDQFYSGKIGGPVEGFTPSHPVAPLASATPPASTPTATAPTVTTPAAIPAMVAKLLAEMKEVLEIAEKVSPEKLSPSDVGTLKRLKNMYDLVSIAPALLKNKSPDELEESCKELVEAKTYLKGLLLPVEGPPVATTPPVVVLAAPPLANPVIPPAATTPTALLAEIKVLIDKLTPHKSNPEVESYLEKLEKIYTTVTKLPATPDNDQIFTATKIAVDNIKVILAKFLGGPLPATTSSQSAR